MSLTTYKKKRNFRQTAEPAGRKKRLTRSLIFVVQKHAATRLHYDFRIEVNGMLVSWAVPKGPSMNPGDKRLAMKVEDHPFDYKDFEGVIPKGNYGAGEVIVWDQGVYMPVRGSSSKKENERIVNSELVKGDLKIVLLGKKLKGEFAIVRMHSEKENTWLLIKKKDEYASVKDILKKDRSVITSRKLEELKKSDSEED